jgi:ribosomal protein S18 acetylase RimI-like enzyme
MMTVMSVLDNPAWHALTSTDADKNIGSGEIAFMDLDMAPFIGMPKWDEVSQRRLMEFGPQDRTWFLLYGSEVKFLDIWEIVFTIPLHQFTCTRISKPPVCRKDVEIVPLNNEHVAEMIVLTERTKPGPFRNRTIGFGNYHGIFEGGKLVAMGGERLHIGNYTEISAICTDPDHRGNGYGAKITHFLADAVLRKGQTPFLHARYDNTGAMDVYKRQGFEFRKEIAFYIFRRKKP